MIRPLSLPARLVLLVAGTTLPLILFAGYLAYQHYQQDRAEAFDRVVQVSRGLQLVLDREMQGIVSGLTVLANSRSLAQEDFESFRQVADAFLSNFPDNPQIVLADKNGQEIFSTAVPAGQPLPKRAERPDRGIVFRTGKPAFSPVFIGANSNKPLVTVTVPVRRNGEVVYDMSFNPPQQVFQQIIEQQIPDKDWTISIFDQVGVNLARVPNPEETTGRKASPTLYAVMFSAREGRARTTSLEGVPLLTGFVRSELTGWIPAAGIAEQTLIAPAVQRFVLTAALGAVMLGVGLAFAVRMATRIARAEALHQLLIDELNHRVKNTLATVQSLSAQTFRGSGDAEARDKFAGRLASLGRTHDVLSAKKWEPADIGEVVSATLAPFESSNPARIGVSGPPIPLSSRTVVMLSMVIHELATNAAKYGALSVPHGRVRVDWGLPSDDTVELRWQEFDGPAVIKPRRKGFGSRLIEDGLPTQVSGTAALVFDSSGVSCVVSFPAQ